MGETLHAIVEEPSSSGANWFCIAQWDFGKAYPLSAVLYQVEASRGWPDVVSAEAHLLRADGVADNGLQCMTRIQLPLPFAALGEVYAALVVGLPLLGAGVRVLFYRN